MSWAGRNPGAVTVVGQGYHPWSPLWKRNQSLYWALATRSWAGHGVFLNPTADWRLLWSRGRAQSPVQLAAARRAMLPRRITPGHWVWTPVAMVPFGRFPSIRRLNRALRTAIVSRLAGERPRLVVLNDPFAEPEEAASLCEGASLVVFDVSDDFIAYDHGGDEASRTRTEERCAALARLAHVVFAINESVAEWYRRINPNTHVVANACHYERFAECAAANAPRAAALRALSRRYRAIAGYYGWMMAHRMDIALLREVMDRHRDWGFVFVGPTDAAVAAELRRAPNAHLFPTVPQDLLPAYVAGFDVCLLPHLRNAHTDGNDPLKLYEYMASGKPVVATPAAGVERFRELIAVASSVDDFSASLTAIVRNDTADLRRARQAAARANSWTVRGDEMERLLAASPAGGRLVPVGA